LALRCICIREKELKKNNDRLAIVIILCAEKLKVTFRPNQTISINGYLDKE
jgi:hypothetical protein